MNHEHFATLFPLGTHLCREPMPPMAEMKRDLELLRRQGFNLVKLQEHWMIDEPREGQYDFSRYEELIAYAGKLELGVYLGLTCEQAPAWLYRRFPDCRMVGRDGRVIPYESPTTLPADGKPGPCYDHPDAMSAQLRFIRELVRVLGRFENLVVWNTWQEIGYWAEGLVGTGVCFCPHTLGFFRHWLKQRFHGDLDGLNRAWNTRYGDWESILPDRGSRANVNAVDIAWGYFMDNIQIGRVLRERAAAIRAADPQGRPVFAHKGGPVIGAGQDWTYARAQDFLGSSCYPAWGSFEGADDHPETDGGPRHRHEALLAEMWNGVAIRYDYIHGAARHDAPVWAAEFQGGPVSTGFHKGRVPSPDDLRRWMLTAVGTGITGLSFWVTRAEIMAAEMNGFSLLDSTGEETPRCLEAARLGRALNTYPALFGQRTRPRAPIGLLVDEWNYQVTRQLSWGGGQLPYSLRGWHRLVWDLGRVADFVELNFAEAEALAAYRVLVLPFPLTIGDAQAAKLAAYVNGGGTLVLEACAGRINEYGVCRRGELAPALAELAGVRQASLTMVREPQNGHRWMPGERTWGEFRDAIWLRGDGPLAGHELRANLYVQTFTLAGGQAVLHCGEDVAGVHRQVGAGQVWLLGSFVGHGGTAYRDPRHHAAIGALLDACGVPSDAVGKLLRRRRVTAQQEAWLLTNPTDKAECAAVDVTGFTRAELLGGGPLPINGNRVLLSVNSLDVVVLVLSR